MKYRAETLLIRELTSTITATDARESSASGMSSTSILIKVETSVMTEFTSCGRLWLMNWRRVSTSFVYTLMISPWACVSK